MNYKLLIGLMLLVAGGMIYLLYRPCTLLMFHVVGWLGLASVVDGWREAATFCRPSDFVVYSLPAALWATSYALIAAYITRSQPRAGRLLAISIVPALGVASEIMQAAGWLPGTFDWADLCCYLIPFVIPFWSGPLTSHLSPLNRQPLNPK